MSLQVNFNIFIYLYNLSNLLNLFPYAFIDLNYFIEHKMTHVETPDPHHEALQLCLTQAATVN